MPTLILDQATGTVTLINGRLELTVETRPGYNPRSLTDLQSGRAFADSDYAWWDAEPAALLGAPGLTTRPDGTGTAVFTLKKGGLELTHTFTLPGDQADVLIEQITLRNPGPHPVDTSAFACGFAKVVHDGQDWLADVAVARLCEVPYRYHPETGARRYHAQDPAALWRRGRLEAGRPGGRRLAGTRRELYLWRNPLLPVGRRLGGRFRGFPRLYGAPGSPAARRLQPAGALERAVRQSVWRRPGRA